MVTQERPFVRSHADQRFRTYLLVVDNVRVDGKVKQRVCIVSAAWMSCWPTANSTR